MAKTARSNQEPSLDSSPFRKVLLEALTHYNDAAWLGEHSPLAAPYLLHDYLAPGMVGATARGAILRNLLNQTAEKIEDRKYGDRYRQIIRSSFFREQKADDVAAQVSIGRTVFFANRQNAVARLETVLIEQLNPAIRLETPAQSPIRLFGYDEVIADCWRALQAGQTVAITGGSGMGKTAVGSYLAQRWGQDKTFWFTLRPGANDHIDSLIFALAYFLFRCGEATLWQELGAELRRINRETGAWRLNSDHVLNILRYAVKQLVAQERGPLLCFDDFDLLQPTLEQHDQILKFLESLRGLTPMVFMSQQAQLNAHHFCALAGFSFTDTRRFLESAEIYLTNQAIEQVQANTHGNPRLVELFAYGIARQLQAFEAQVAQQPVYRSFDQALIRSQREQIITEAIDNLPKSPSVQFLFDRIWRQLTVVEQRVLTELSVYRNPAPADVWQRVETAGALEELLADQLVQHDNGGGVYLTPIYRPVVYKKLPDDRRRQLHAHAAQVRTDRAAYTAAAYHLIRAGVPTDALLLWRTYQQQEINQGQAQTALKLFQDLLDAQLPPPAQQMLELTCDQLSHLTGRTLEARQPGDESIPFTETQVVEANLFGGTVDNDLGNLERAKQRFRRALAVAERLVEVQLARIHKGLGWMYMRQRELNQALYEANFARYEAENIRGFVHELRCEYTTAEHCYQAALEFAYEINHTEGIAKTSANLAGLYGRQGKFDLAKMCQQRAEECYTRIGKLMAQIGVKINWGFIFNLAGEHAAALNVLQEAMTQMESYSLTISSWQRGLINQSLAEAYLGLHNLDEAESCVRRVIELEEGDILPDAYRTFGEILFQRGQLEQAQRLLHDALNLIAQQEEPDLYMSGYIWRALARVYQAQGADARAAKQTALTFFTNIALPYEVEKTHHLLPEV